jgi:ATP-dependent DNA ligase
VCEVEFSQLTKGRFRHNAHFLRWRPDREPRSCTYEQLEVATPVALADVLSARHDGT